MINKIVPIGKIDLKNNTKRVTTNFDFLKAEN